MSTTSIRALRVSSLISLALLGGCATNPATGERQLSLISEQQEIQMGRQSAQQVQQALGFVDDRELQQYVARIGKRLAALSERPQLPWEFHVVDDPTINAFALPGGFIYVTRGLLNLLTSEAELASVLGHEIGHVTARHSVNQISKQQLAQFGLGLGSILVPEVAAASSLIGAGLNLLSLKYSRDDERESDALAFDYVREAGYAASEAEDVFTALGRAQPKNGSALPGWLTTHPAPAERVESAQARSASAPADSRTARIGREEYLRQIDGLIYGTNPRNGFLREGVFYHPELRFQLRLPEGWQTQNLTQAVLSAPPDGAAVLELTLVPGTPEQAMNRFAAQAGVQVGRPTQRSLRDVRAITTEFRAGTDRGALNGTIAFARYRDLTYRLIGYGPASTYGEYQSAVVRSIDSFGPVTDRAVLDTQPHRMDIVRLQDDQTLEDFARRFASTIPVEELALINQVPGASTVLEAGTLVKRVV